MTDQQMLTVAQVAEELQVTLQTVRNWIDTGALPGVKIGRRYRIRRQDLDAVLARADADSSSLAVRRDLWAPEEIDLPRRRDDAGRAASIWDGPIVLPRRA